MSNYTKGIKHLLYFTVVTIEAIQIKFSLIEL